ncbi:MAG: SPFH domain-containing protein [Spirochaetia bacterium]|jgi:regulator of protease activity HflC (stomatin/prohibitin superfamily)
MIKEIKRDAAPGIVILLVLLLIIAAAIGGLAWSVNSDNLAVAIASGVVIAVAGFLLAGLFTVNPNQGRVLQLFGAYRGTARNPGLRWANPFYTKKAISLRVRNFETAKLKVNDKRGNPVEIATVVVWRVVDTAEAAFQVDNYENYVHVQSEAALRNLATGYPYDAHKEGEVALSSHTPEVSAKLKTEIQDRLEKAGVEVIETRVSHLAYSPEIAAAMLRRQQASAVVAARQTIVEGAVGMVENALELLAAKKVVDLDEERKATMVSNLLVVLCSEQNTMPVVNTGSLYR